MDRRRPLQASAGEKLADEMLGRVVERWPGARLIMKPRIADVLDINDSGLAADEFSYALRAHFDFVICRHDDSRLRDIPQFAVEFDGRQHQTDAVQIARDRLKDSICAQLGLPIVRAREPALKRVGDQALLEWLAELWFVYHDLYLGIADDQDTERDDTERPAAFNYARLWHDLVGKEDLDRLGIDGPHDPFAPLRREFQRFVHGYKVIGMWKSFTGHDEQDRARGLITLELAPGRYLIGEGRCHLGSFIPAPLLPERIALDLALVQIVEHSRAYEEGRAPPISTREVADATGALVTSPLLTLPGLSDDDFYEIMLSWMGPNPPEEERRRAWMFAHVERHENEPDPW